jgi:uncharacterized protein DUF3800
VVCHGQTNVGELILSGHRALSRLWEVSRGEDINTMPLAMACCDESGKLHDSKFVAFAGCIAFDQHWAVFEVKWRERITKENIAYVSMKDAIHFRNEFSGWKERTEERDQLLKDLATIGMDLIGFWIPMVIDTDRFKAMPEQKRKRLKNPQYMGFEGCVKAIIKGSPRQDVFLNLYCDLSEEYAETCLKLFQRMRFKEPELKQRCVAITFADDTKLGPLQLADMMAYCARADHLRHVDKPDSIVEELLAIFRREKTTEGYTLVYGSEDALGNGTIEKS